VTRDRRCDKMASCQTCFADFTSSFEPTVLTERRAIYVPEPKRESRHSCHLLLAHPTLLG